MNEPIHINDDVFEKEVLSSDVPVLVDFWAPWCAPCRMVAPTLDRIAQEYAGKIVVAKVNTDENPDLSIRYNIRGIPTMLFFADGRVIEQQVGALSHGALKQRVEKFLAETTTSKPQVQ